MRTDEERMRRQVLSDIERFKKTGRLPDDRDVLGKRGEAEDAAPSPYWEWVGRNGGNESPGNADVSEQAALYTRPGGDKVLALRRWVEEESDFTEREHAVYQACYVEGFTEEEAAERFGLSDRRVKKIKEQIKQKIAEGFRP